MSALSDYFKNITSPTENDYIQPSTVDTTADTDSFLASVGRVVSGAGGVAESALGDMATGIGVQLGDFANWIDPNNVMGANSDYLSNNGVSGYGNVPIDLHALAKNIVDVGQKWDTEGQETIARNHLAPAYDGKGFLGRISHPIDYLTNPNGFLTDMAIMGGSAAPTLGLMALTPELGFARVATGLMNIGKLGKMAELATRAGKAGTAARAGIKAANFAGRVVGSPTVGRMANWAIKSAPMNVLMNAGDTYADLKAQGYSDSEIAQRMRNQMAEEFPQDFVTGALGGLALSGRLGRLFGKNPGRLRSFAQNVAINTPINVTSEYWDEANQQRLQNKYTNKEHSDSLWDMIVNGPTEDEMNAGASAAGPALFFGIGGGLRNAIRGPKGFQDNIANGTTAAETEARNEEIAQNVANANANNSAAAANVQGQQVQAPELQTPQVNTSDNGGNGGNGGASIVADAQPLMGQRMDNGENGCVEAVTKIGAKNSRFLAKELANGIVNVDALVQDANDSNVPVIPFDASQLQEGDVIVYGDNDHVVTADGQGGYVGNSSSQQKVVHGSNYNEMGGLKPTKIIKTGGNYGGSGNAESQQSTGSSNVDSSLPLANIANAIAKNTGLPANFIWAQMNFESDHGNSQLAREDHNYGGIKNTDGSWAHFDSDQEYIDHMSKYLPKYRENGIYNAKNIQEYAAALQNGGYFEDGLEHYTNGMASILKQAGISENGQATVGSGNSSKISAPQLQTPQTSKPLDFSGIMQNAAQGDKAVKDFFASFVEDTYGSSEDVDTMYALSKMMNNKDKFKNTKANRLALAKDFADQLKEYWDNVYSKRQPMQTTEQTTTETTTQTNAPATQQAPTIKAATPNLTSAAIMHGTQTTDAPTNQQSQDESAKTQVTPEKAQQAMAEPTAKANTQEAVTQGKTLQQFANQNNVKLQPSLSRMLAEGQPKAIRAAQAQLQPYYDNLMDAMAAWRSTRAIRNEAYPNAYSPNSVSDLGVLMPQQRQEQAQAEPTTAPAQETPRVSTVSVNAQPVMTQTGTGNERERLKGRTRTEAVQAEAFAEPPANAKTPRGRAQGLALQNLADEHKVTLTPAVTRMLKEGQPKAIRRAQQQIREAIQREEAEEAAQKRSKKQSEDARKLAEAQKLARAYVNVAAGYGIPVDSLRQQVNSNNIDEVKKAINYLKRRIKAVDRQFDFAGFEENVRNNTADDVSQQPEAQEGANNNESESTNQGTSAQSRSTENQDAEEVPAESTRDESENAQVSEEKPADKANDVALKETTPKKQVKSVSEDSDVYKLALAKRYGESLLSIAQQRKHRISDTVAKDIASDDITRVTKANNFLAKELNSGSVGLDTKSVMKWAKLDVDTDNENGRLTEQSAADDGDNNADGHMTWIKEHPFKYDNNKSVEENAAEASRLAKEYLDKYGETVQINTPERKELRRKIIEELYGNGAEKKEHKAFIVIGLPASGKSSAVAEPLAKANGALIIDSDEAKERLPEFADGLLASAVHEESSRIADRIRTIALDAGDNLVLPLVGKTESKLRAKVQELKSSGYTVSLHYVGLPVEEAVERGKGRFKATGRNVPIDYIRAVGLKPKQNFDKIKTEEGVDSYAEWSNRVARGQRPRLLETRPKGLHAEDWLGGRGQQLLHQSSDSQSRAGENQTLETEASTKPEVNTPPSSRSEKQSGFSSTSKLPKLQPKIGVGKDVTVTTDSGKEIHTRYVVLPVKSVITSNEPETMAVNRKYPQELQPRDRQRVAMQDQVNQMAGNLRPEDLTDSRNLNQGAPIVRDDGVVLNGNGRALAIKTAFNRKRGKTYRDYILNHGEEYGLSKEDIARLKSANGPMMLVREVTDNLSEDDVKDIINSTTGGSRMGAAEQAKADAKKIRLEDLDSFEPNDRGDLTTVANRDFVRGIINRIVPKNERNAYYDEHGNVNADGIQRIKRALFAKAYGNDDLLSKMAESTDDSTRNITNGLTNAAPLIARVNQKMDDGVLPKYPLAKTVSDAVTRYDMIRNSDQFSNIDEYLNQQDLFSEYSDSQEVRDLLRAFDDYRRSGKKVSRFMRDIGEIIDGMENPQEGTLAGMETKPRSLREVIQQAKDEVDNNQQGADLFANTEQKKEAPAQETRTEKKSAAKEESQAQTANNNSKEERHADWGNEDDVMADMEKMFGVKRKTSVPQKISNEVKSVSNKFFDSLAKDDDNLDNLLDEFHHEANKLSVNPIMNPKVWSLLFRIGAVYVRRGFRKFANWADKIREVVAKDIKPEDVNPWLSSVWKAIQSMPKDKALDADKFTTCVRFVGIQYEHGNQTLDAVKKVADNSFGEDFYRENKAYVNTAFDAVNAFYHPEDVMAELEEADNHADNGTDEVASRTGEGTNSDAVGRNNENGESGTDGRQRVPSTGTEVRSQSGVHVRNSSTTTSREQGNRGVQAEESNDRTSSTRSTQHAGSGNRSTEGDGTYGGERQGDRTALKTAEDGRKHETVEKIKNTVKAKAGSLKEKIQKALPMLLPPQQDDVVFAEKRLIEKGGQGVMFTNGTGTGKTYTGMGVVKRFWDAGKKNILVVVPTATIGTQWRDTAVKSFGFKENDNDANPVHILEDTNDAGKGLTITTYANFGANNSLINRDWDLIIPDESQNLMSEASGKATRALRKMRELTYHHNELYQRYDDLHADELAKVKAIENEDERRKAYDKYNDARKKQMEKWEAMDAKDKPRVVFLSATPFSWVPDVDYAEGYLFDYDRAGAQKRAGGYNQPNAKDDFFIKHFGYRMRNGKLTKPDGKVDNRTMEVEFNKWLKETGVVSGRSIDVDKDYDRGWILTPNAIGQKIDHGLDVLQQGSDSKYSEYAAVITKTFDKRKKNYLLEYLKAKEVVPIIKQYLQQGKKVVVFHQSVKEQEVGNPFDIAGKLDRGEWIIPGDNEYNGLSGQELEAKLRSQQARFEKECPELFNGSIEGLESPIKTLTKAFGDKIVLFNGTINKKVRQANKDDFNNDNGKSRVILVQQDAGNAGISLHDVTGKYPRVLINLGIPSRPTYAMQIEGRIYRVGVQSNAVFRYLTTGTNLEKGLFASTVGGRASTAENLAMGDEARNLVESFRDGYMETMDNSWKRRLPGAEGEGTGGKEMDYTRNNATSEFDRAKAFYYARQKKTSRDKSAEGNDYYATPEPVGQKMVEWLDAKSGDRMLEPSAGHGAISRWFSEDTQNTIIEPSGTLGPEAQMVTPDARYIRSTFENYNVINKFDGIAMNPPFGTGGKTAVEHVAKAYKHLADGGRLIAIIPEGPAADKRFDKWFNGVQDDNGKYKVKPPEGAILVRDIKLPSATFERAGTKVRTHMVIIEKHVADNAAAKNYFYGRGESRTRDLSGAKDIDELFDSIEGMTMPERYRGGVTQETASNEESNSSANNATATNSDSNLFDTKPFKHTKTGENIPAVKIVPNVSRDDYKKIASMARAAGGYYSKFAHRFLFKDNPAARDRFMERIKPLITKHATDTDSTPKKHYSVSTVGTKKDLDNLLNKNKVKYSVKEKKFSIGGKVIVGLKKYSTTAYHGSPNNFYMFDLKFLGSGEGAQVHGWGLYFAKAKESSQRYHEKETAKRGEQGYSFDGKTVDYKELSQKIRKGITGEKGTEYNPFWNLDLSEDTAPNEVEQKVASAFAGDIENMWLENDEDGFSNADVLENIKNRYDYEMNSIVNDLTPAHRAAYERGYQRAVKFLQQHEIGKGEMIYPKGAFFTVEIPDESKMLDEQKPIKDQPAIMKIVREFGWQDFMEKVKGKMHGEEPTGRNFYRFLSGLLGGDKEASLFLSRQGIPGITYEGGIDGRCYVVFDDQAIKILDKYTGVGEDETHYDRTVKALVDEIKNVLPAAAKVKWVSSRVTVTMPNGSEIQFDIRDVMELSGEDADRVRRENNIPANIPITVNGSEYVVDGKAFVELSRNGQIGTAAHELVHIAQELYLTDKEMAALHRGYDKIAQETGRDFDEVIADAGRDLYLKKVKYTNYNKIFRKLWQAIDALRDMFRGVYRANKVLRSIVDTNEVFTREQNNSDSTTRYSAEEKRGEDGLTEKEREAPKGWFSRLTHNAGMKLLGLSGDKVVEVERNGKNGKTYTQSYDVSRKNSRVLVQSASNGKDMGGGNYWLVSPSRLAKKFPRFGIIYRMAEKAMNLLTSNRDHYNKMITDAEKLCKSKEDREKLGDILFTGDDTEHEYTRKELEAEGVKDNVIKAYFKIRAMAKGLYKLVDEAHRRPEYYKRTLNQTEYERLLKMRDKGLATILSDKEADDDKRLVQWKQPHTWDKTYYGANDDTLKRFENDNAMVVLMKKQREDGLYDVKVRESIPPLTNRTGYIPHYFFEHMLRVVDEKGNYVRDELGRVKTLGSARTRKEALNLADDIVANAKKYNLKDGERIVIEDKTFDFARLGMDSTQTSAIMSEKDYYKAMAKMAKDTRMTPEEMRKEMNEVGIKKTNKHRFYGNALKRKGVSGYTKDLDYVLRHFANSAVRYHAMETEFKPKAISWYERAYGSWEGKPGSAEADYAHDYISDINGNPTNLETRINGWLNNSKFFRYFIAPHFGNRAALDMASKISGITSQLCLGFLNVSSAMLNLTQVINTAAYTGNWRDIGRCLAKGARRHFGYTNVRGTDIRYNEARVLADTGVLHDIGLDSGAGYDKSRLGKLGKASMILFKTSESTVRIGTILAAYEEGRRRGMSHRDAVEFAKDVNRKSNFDYSVADAANLFRRGSIISQLVLQFKKYGFKELEVMADMLSSKTNLKQKAIFWSLYFLSAGLLGFVPAGDWLDEEVFDGKMKLGIEKTIGNMAGDSTVGKMLGRIALFGAGSIANADVSRRAGISDIVPTRLDLSTVAGAGIGKAGALAVDVPKWLMDMNWANGAQAIRDVSPGIYNILAATIMGQSYGKRGRVNSVYDSAWDRILRGMGFSSVDERLDADVPRIITMDKSERSKEQQEAIDRYIDDPTSENKARYKELGVTDKRVETERKKKGQTRLERSFDGVSKEDKKSGRYDNLVNFAQ